MFRGLGVTTLREHGLSESKVALWSSIIFGLVHLSNAITSGVGATPQAVIVSFARYFFYLIRRRTGSNVLNSIIHGLFDFSIITGTAILVDQTAYVGSFAAILAYLITGIVIFKRRHRIEPTPTLAACERSSDAQVGDVRSGSGSSILPFCRDMRTDSRGGQGTSRPGSAPHTKTARPKTSTG